MALDGAAGEEAGARNFFNPRRRYHLSPEVEEWWSQWHHIRTWFVNNWNDWEWPEDFEKELEKLAAELSTEAIENLHENKSREDIASSKNIPAKIP